MPVLISWFDNTGLISTYYTNSMPIHLLIGNIGLSMFGPLCYPNLPNLPLLLLSRCRLQLGMSSVTPAYPGAISVDTYPLRYMNSLLHPNLCYIWNFRDTYFCGIGAQRWIAACVIATVFNLVVLSIQVWLWLLTLWWPNSLLLLFVLPCRQC